MLRTAHESEIDSLIFEYSEDEKWALFEELLVDPASDISQARLVSLFDDGCRTARTIYGRVELRRNIINSNNLQSSNITCLKYEDKSNQSCNLWRIGSVNAPLITQVCSTDAGPMEVYPPEYKNFDRKKITATCAIKARARALRVTCEPNF